MNFIFHIISLLVLGYLFFELIKAKNKVLFAKIILNSHTNHKNLKVYPCIVLFKSLQNLFDFELEILDIANTAYIKVDVVKLRSLFVSYKILKISLKAESKRINVKLQSESVIEPNLIRALNDIDSNLFFNT